MQAGKSADLDWAWHKVPGYNRSDSNSFLINHLTLFQFFFSRRRQVQAASTFSLCLSYMSTVCHVCPRIFLLFCMREFKISGEIKCWTLFFFFITTLFSSFVRRDEMAYKIRRLHQDTSKIIESCGENKKFKLCWSRKNC